MPDLVMMHPAAEHVETRTGECGCLEEVYLFNGIDLTLHFEPNGDVDAFMDGGDWGEIAWTIEAGAISNSEARNLVFAEAERLTDGPEL